MLLQNFYIHLLFWGSLSPKCQRLTYPCLRHRVCTSVGAWPPGSVCTSVFSFVQSCASASLCMALMRFPRNGTKQHLAKSLRKSNSTCVLRQGSLHHGYWFLGCLLGESHVKAMWLIVQRMWWLSDDWQWDCNSQKGGQTLFCIGVVDAGLDVREWRILERDAVALGLTCPGTPCFIVVWSILCPLYVTYLFPCVCVYVCVCVCLPCARGR